MKRVVAVLGLLLGLVGVPAHAESHVETVTFMVVRTTSGASHFNLDLTAYSPPSGAFIGEIEGVVRAGRFVRSDGGSMNGARMTADGIDLGDQHIRACGVADCSGSGNGLLASVISYSADRSKGDINALFVVMHGVDLDYRLDGAAGWKVVRTHLDYRTVNTWDSSRVRAASGAYGAAMIEGATAAGSGAGSLAVAAPPCSIAMTGVVSRGVGQIQLVGGATRPTFTCPTDRGPIASYTNRRTTWSVTGWAAGDSSMANTMLLVIDRPTRLPHAAP